MQRTPCASPTVIPGGLSPAVYIDSSPSSPSKFAEPNSPIKKRTLLFDSARKSRKDLLSSPPAVPPQSPASSSSANALDKQRAHRGKVVQEILSSEQVYSKLLADFLDLYYYPALQLEQDQASMDFMSRSKLVVLCTNLEQLRTVSAQLVRDLDNAISSAASMPHEAALGQVFLNTSTLLKLFGQYAENHSNARHDLTAIMTRNAHFKQFWDALSTPPPPYDLASYLILPIQRVPRYLMLLRALLESTPPRDDDDNDNGNGNEEHANLVAAVQAVRQAAEFMNDCITRAEHKERLRDLQAKFVGSVVVDFIGGVGSEATTGYYRALEHEGELVRITSKGAHKTYYFHLLTDALVYSKVVRGNGSDNASLQFKFHRALPLINTPGFACSVHDLEDGILAGNAHYLQYTALELYARTRTCAFQIRTKDKSFIVYAATLAIKREWMRRLGEVIAANAERTAAAVAVAPRRSSSNSTGTIAATAAAAAAADKCQMCQTPFYVFARRAQCDRCALQVCGQCGSNHRVLSAASPPSSGVTSCCCLACAWEMDGTALDDAPDQFRVKLWADEVQSLLPGQTAASTSAAGGEAAVLRPVDNAQNKDAAEALKRLYFSLSFVSDGDDGEEEETGGGRVRGPSNCGTLGPDAAFSVPLTSSSLALPRCVVHVHMVGVGEIGTARLDLEQVVSADQVARAQPFYLWHVVQPSPTHSTAMSTLALTLMNTNSSSSSRGAVNNFTDKEKRALRIGVKIRYELHVPPALWHPQQQQRRRRASSVARTRPGAAKLMTNQPPEEIAVRLQRFMAIDDAQSAVGGGGSGGVVQDGDDEQMRDKLNVVLLGEYERAVLANPSRWLLCLLDILYSDCLAYFGALAKKRADLYSDTQVTLLNRLSHFHKQNCTVLERYETQAPTVAPLLSATAASQQPPPAPSSSSSSSSPTKKEAATQKALRGLSRRRDSEYFDEDLDSQEREEVLRLLFQQESAYVRTVLQPLDDVFIHRLLLLAQGANIRLSKTNVHDAWAEKMGFDGGLLDELTNGVQATTVPTAAVTSKMTKPHSQRFKRGNAPPHLPTIAGNDNATTREAAGEEEEAAVTDSASRRLLRQPHCLVWLQGVHQMRMANDDFLAALEHRLLLLGGDGGEEFACTPSTCVGDLLERFSAIMPVYASYAASYSQVLQDLAADKSLAALLLACQQSPSSSSSEKLLPFGHYAQLPLVRVQQYADYASELLLLVKPGSKDWTALRNALGKFLDAAHNIQRAQRRHKNFSRLREIECEVEDWPHGFALNPPQHQQRWLVREGWLQERQSQGDRMRYVFLFSDCVCITTAIVKKRKTMHILKQVGQELLFGGGGSNDSSSSASSSSASMTSSGGGAATATAKKFRFHQMFWLKQQLVQVRDMPQGVTMAGGDVKAVSFQLVHHGGGGAAHQLTLLVPSDAEYCMTKPGPAAVELAKARHKLMVTAAEAPAEGLMDAARDKIKAQWMHDLDLCSQMCMQGLVFEEEDAAKKERLVSMRAASSSSTVVPAVRSVSNRSLFSSINLTARGGAAANRTGSMATRNSIASLMSEDCRSLVDEQDDVEAFEFEENLEQQQQQQDERTVGINKHSSVSSTDTWASSRSSGTLPGAGRHHHHNNNRDSLNSVDVRSVYKYSVSASDDEDDEDDGECSSKRGVPLPPAPPIAAAASSRQVSFKPVVDEQPAAAAAAATSVVTSPSTRLKALDFDML